MIRRYLSLAALASSVVFLGCAAPSDGQEEIVQDVSAAATLDCDPFNDTCDPTTKDYTSPVAFTLATFDTSTGLLTGTNAKGQTLSAAFTTATAFRPANLNRYQPGDPYYPSVLAYNTALASGATGDTGLYTAISGLLGDTARVWVNRRTGTIRAFRPVP